MSDRLGTELSERGFGTVRLAGETGDLHLLPPDQTKDIDVLLKGTILAMEYSQHGLKESPYDFFYIAARFSLQRVSDARVLWQANVATYRKLPPAPDSTQTSIANEAISILADQLVKDQSVRQIIEQTKERE